MIKKITNSPIDNQRLSEIEINIENQLDDFDFSNVIVKKPWGHEYLTYQEKSVSIWILHIKKDAATSMHSHLHKRTNLIVLSGKVVCSTLNGSFDLSEEDMLILDKKVFHSTKALTDNVLVMEIEFPSKKTDLVRLNDAYGRQSKGYEKQNEMCFDLSAYERVFLNGSDLNRKIGCMNISVQNVKSYLDLLKYIKSNNDSLNIFISGCIEDHNEDKLEPGDQIKYENITGKNIIIKSPLKILNIKKNILDFD